MWKKGQKIKFHTELQQYPFTIVRKGETGVIVRVSNKDDKLLAIKLDKHHSGLDDWKNQIHFYRGYQGTGNPPSKYIKKVN